MLLQDPYQWSLAKVEKIESNSILVSGVKILNNTPIFDLQNLESKVVLEQNEFAHSEHSVYKEVLKSVFQESLVENSPSEIVDKVIDKNVPTLKTISYTEAVLQDLTKIVEQGKLDFYHTTEDAVAAINFALSMDPVSINTTTRNLKREISAVALDNLMIIFEKVGEVIKIFKIIWSTHFVETKTEHTKEWLDSLSTILNLEQSLISS